ncbi:MAG: hypothetical protein A4E35_01013 [Methanoregula sp. PtaU1.Bin051]|nr:MAG: hypothetical protein A4E35_01013 [Methanoregula sp. PtaU1.Bin051]
MIIFMQVKQAALLCRVYNIKEFFYAALMTFCRYCTLATPVQALSRVCSRGAAPRTGSGIAVTDRIFRVFFDKRYGFSRAG